LPLAFCWQLRISRVKALEFPAADNAINAVDHLEEHLASRSISPAERQVSVAADSAPRLARL
jgi:hypothetical protein